MKKNSVKLDQVESLSPRWKQEREKWEGKKLWWTDFIFFYFSFFLSFFRFFDWTVGLRGRNRIGATFNPSAISRPSYLFLLPRSFGLSNKIATPVPRTKTTSLQFKFAETTKKDTDITLREEEILCEIAWYPGGKSIHIFFQFLSLFFIFVCLRAVRPFKRGREIHRNKFRLKPMRII